MNAFGFRADQKIIDVLRSSHFTVSAEVIPPRNGMEQAAVLSQIQTLVGAGAEFLSVTKGAGGSLRGGSLPIAQAIKERFHVPAIAHFTCRDLSPQEIENNLIDHHYFGIRNILALRGDPPMDQPNWTPHSQSYPYAYQLIEQIRKMNAGDFLVRPTEGSGQKVSTDFCIGAAVYPEHPDPAERLEFFRRKVDAGAEYAITQMIFDVDAYARFLETCARAGISIPVLPGFRMLRDQAQARKMQSRFGCQIPASVLGALPETSAPGEWGAAVSVFEDLTEQFKRAGAPGMHLFVLSDTLGCKSLLETLRVR